MTDRARTPNSTAAHSARQRRMFVPLASGRRLCLHPPRSNKTPKIHSKKLSAPNHSSICFCTALQTQKFQPIAQRRAGANAVVLAKHAKRKRRITPNPAGNWHLTSRPQLKRRESSSLEIKRRRSRKLRRPTIHRRNPRRRSRPPLQLRPRLPRLPARTHRRQAKRHRRRRQNPRLNPRTRRRHHRRKRRPILAPPETQRPLASHRRSRRRRHLRRRPVPHRPLPLSRNKRSSSQLQFCHIGSKFRPTTILLTQFFALRRGRRGPRRGSLFPCADFVEFGYPFAR